MVTRWYLFSLVLLGTILGSDGSLYILNVELRWAFKEYIALLAGGFLMAFLTCSSPRHVVLHTHLVAS